MTASHMQPVYIAGVAETPLGRVTEHSELGMIAIAAREALAEAGMTYRDVDGLFVHQLGTEGTVQVGEFLGIQPRWADSTDIGGASFEAFVHHAMLAVASGACEVALITHASRQRTKGREGRHPTSLSTQFEQPYKLPSPLGRYALIAARHMYQYGTTPEQLAAVAVTARKWAQLNPKAWSRDPLTIEDVLASELICDPFHKLDCCLVTDGGGAVVVTNAARARNAAKRAVRVIGAAESHGQLQVSQMPDLTVSPGKQSGPEAFAAAGITPEDVDVLELYDAFTITPIIALEDLGFCAKGDGGPFVAEGRLEPGGPNPGQTSGGGLSYNHPGAFGLLLLIEAVRQVRGEAGARQVPNAKIGVAHAIGGQFSTAATVVLARE